MITALKSALTLSSFSKQKDAFAHLIFIETVAYELHTFLANVINSKLALSGAGTGGCPSCTEDCQIVRSQFSCSQSFPFLQNFDMHLFITSSFSTHYKKSLGLVINGCILLLCVRRMTTRKKYKATLWLETT